MKPTQPIYQHIISAIVEGIDQQSYPPGSQIPSQRALCDQFNTSLMTVRRALNELLQEEIVYAIPGKGIFVAEPKQSAEVDPLIGFTDDMAARGMRASSRVLEAKHTTANHHLARRLNVVLNTPLIYLRRLRLAGGRPMAVQENYLLARCCPTLLEHSLDNESLYHLLQNDYHIQLHHAQSTIEAVLALPEEADLLQITAPAALLVTEQITYLNKSEAFECVRTAYRGDRYHLQRVTS
ncbi:MAG: GntR family transcriptional regulator [Anaerolineaceae bacterium]|nr:GntR family transcriptional regulator [Anaerolineaceae bacterium]